MLFRSSEPSRVSSNVQSISVLNINKPIEAPIKKSETASASISVKISEPRTMAELPAQKSQEVIVQTVETRTGVAPLVRNNIAPTPNLNSIRKLSR